MKRHLKNTWKQNLEIHPQDHLEPHLLEKIIRIVLVLPEKTSVSLIWKLMLLLIYHLYVFGNIIYFISCRKGELFLLFSAVCGLLTSLTSWHWMRIKVQKMKTLIRDIQGLEDTLNMKPPKIPLRNKIFLLYFCIIPLVRGTYGFWAYDITSKSGKKMFHHVIFGIQLQESGFEKYILLCALTLHIIMVTTLPNLLVFVFISYCDNVSYILKKFHGCVDSEKTKPFPYNSYVSIRSLLKNLNDVFSSVSFLLLTYNTFILFISIYKAMKFQSGDPWHLDRVVGPFLSGMTSIVYMTTAASFPHYCCTDIKQTLQVIYEKEVLQSPFSCTSVMLKALVDEDVYTFSTWGDIEMKKGLVLKLLGTVTTFGVLFCQI